MENRNLSTIQRYTGDMLSVVRHLNEAVERQKSDQKVLRMAEAHDLLQRISQVLDNQIAGLRRHQVTIGGEPSASLKETVASTLGQAAGLIGMARPDKVSLMLRDDYTALNMAAIAYTMLHTTALALKDERTGAIALSNLRDLTPLITEINEIMPRVLVQELGDEAEQVDMSIISEAIRGTQAAWQRDVVHTGHTHNWEEDPGAAQAPGETPVI